MAGGTVAASASRAVEIRGSSFSGRRTLKDRSAHLTAGSLVRGARLLLLGHFSLRATWPGAMVPARGIMSTEAIARTVLHPVRRFAGLSAPLRSTRFSRCRSTLVMTRASSSGTYNKMTVRELKGLLSERGLPTTGKKAELIARLEEGDDGGEEKEASEPEREKKEEKKDDDDEEDEGPQPPYGSKLPDPHEGKPEKILDEEGRIRHLCLDGKYRRGDPDSIECKPENFAEWLSEWVVAARTGQLEGLPQKTFLPEEDKESNPKGTLKRAGEPMKSEDVLVKGEGPDGKPLWSYKDAKMKPAE